MVLGPFSHLLSKAKIHESDKVRSKLVAGWGTIDYKDPADMIGLTPYILDFGIFCIVSNYFYFCFIVIIIWDDHDKLKYIDGALQIRQLLINLLRT